MRRFLLAAVFFLSSANAEEVNTFDVDQHSQKSHKCRSPKRGPPGPRGIPGTNGVNGPTGPTGPAGPPSGDAIIPYATGDQILPITGDPEDVYMLSYNLTGTPFPPIKIVNGVITLPDPAGDGSFNVPEDRVISALAASITYARDAFPNPSGIEINMTTEVWIAPPEDPTRFTFSGVSVAFPTFSTPATPPNVLFLNAGPTTFNFPVRGGSRILVIFRAASSEPLPFVLLVTGSAGMRL